MEIATGGSHELLFWDENGMLSSLDTHPTIPCGNGMNYTRSALQKWGEMQTLVVGQPVFLKDTRTADLRRASASATSSPAPWHLLVQKKILLPFKGSDVRLSKTIFCSRRSGSAQFDCCVEKQSYRPGGGGVQNVTTSAQQKELRSLMVSL